MAEPAITVRAVHDSGTPNTPPTRYVIHATAGGRGFPRESAAGVARSTGVYFQQQIAGGSAHYIHDIAGEEHCVPENVIAWHAPPNQYSIGDEICADPSYTRAQWLDPAVWPAVHRSAVRCREVCDRYGIPKVKLSPADLLAGKHGICGHVDVSNAWHQSTHWDPGPNFPWDKYMQEVNGSTPAPPAPAPTPVTNLPTLKYGDRSAAVSHLQSFMTHTFPSYNNYPVTGLYGDLTKAGIAEFQRRVAITGPDADGSIVGPQTNAALYKFGYRV